MVGKAYKIFFVLLMMWSTAAFGTVKAQVDRFNISEMETLTLSIEISDNDSGEPETAALEKDFEVLSRNYSSSYSVINGAMSSKSTWMIHLRPRRTGALTIPAIKVGSAATQPITVQVTKAAAREGSDQKPSGDIWIDMDVEPKQVWVQQQAIVSIRIYQVAALNQAQLSEPAPPNAIIERLGEDARYQTTRNGRVWQVLERRYALFPQQSGQIDIEPLQLDGSIIVRNSMFNSPFAQSARPIRVRSNALTLEALPKPADWDGGDWLPAAHIELTEDWPSTTVFNVGEPVTRTLTLRSKGLLSSQLPSIFSMLPDNLKAYPDQPKLSDDKAFEGLSGSRQEKVAIMPMQAGTYILPQIDIPWWNTETGKSEIATIPARTFKVLAAAGTQTRPAQQVQKPVIQEPSEAQASDASVSAPEETGWKWLALITSSGWLLTLVWLFVKHKRYDSTQDDGNNQRASNLKQARQSVALACQQNDSKACEQALLGFAQLQWPDASVNSLTALACQCETDLADEIRNLEACLYAFDKTDWAGEELLQAFRKADFGALHSGSAKSSAALPDLYPD